MILAPILLVIILDKGHLVILGRRALIGGRLRDPPRSGRRHRVGLGNPSKGKESLVRERQGFELRDRVGGMRRRKGLRRVRRCSVPKDPQSLETTVCQGKKSPYQPPIPTVTREDDAPGQMVNLTCVNTLPKAFCTG